MYSENPKFGQKVHFVPQPKQSNSIQANPLVAGVLEIQTVQTFDLGQNLQGKQKKFQSFKNSFPLEMLLSFSLKNIKTFMFQYPIMKCNAIEYKNEILELWRYGGWGGILEITQNKVRLSMRIENRKDSPLPFSCICLWGMNIYQWQPQGKTNQLDLQYSEIGNLYLAKNPGAKQSMRLIHSKTRLCRER